MSYRLKDKNKKPPRPGFAWIDPDTSQMVDGPNYMAWRNNAIEERTANGLSISSEEEMEDQLCAHLSPEVRAQICVQMEDGQPEPILGVGATLKRTLARIGIHACFSCMDLAGRMDKWGPDGCEEHMGEIVGIMQENANRKNWLRFLPWKEQGAEMLVRHAIAKVRATQ